MSVLLRPEASGDERAIRMVHELAFAPSAAEAQLVGLLREAGKADVSLVAEQNAEIVGHILFSKVTIESAPPDCLALGLAPLGVLPEFQNKCIGSKLVREGLKVCAATNCDVVVVLGHPAYYPRFGFSRASDFRLINEFGVDEPFMALELTKGMLEQVSGLVKYASEFAVVGT